MARLTITEAIHQSPIGRTAFYAKIKKGLISVSVDGDDKYIDSSELIRVFPNLKKPNAENEEEQTPAHAVENDKITMAVQENDIKHLREQIRRQESQLDEYRKREEKHLQLLEAPKQQPNPIVRWWNGLGGKDED